MRLAVALPVLLCASCLFNSNRIIQSFVFSNPGEQTEAVVMTRIKNSAKSSDDPTTTWYEQSKAVQSLKKELSKSLSPQEKLHWFETPNFHPFPREIKCPSPKPFKQPPKNVTLLDDFTMQEKETLRQQLENVSSTTIRDAFLPWINKGGFHPDLILHGAKIAGHIIGIFDGKLTFWGKHSSAKARLLAEHLESVLYELHKQGLQLPDVVFPYVARSIPRDSLTAKCARHSAVPMHLQDRYDSIPVAGIAMDPTIHTGVALLPNMYFGNLQAWDRYTQQLMEGGKADTPWNKRRKRVFWRGKIYKYIEFNAPRLEALQAAARDGKNFDVSLTSGCEYLRGFAKNITRLSPLAPEWLPSDYFLKQTRCSGQQRTPHSKFTKYWAQLNLPGSSFGSYSKNLQNLWPMGAATMIWNQSAVEFYYSSLKPGITHVWVNETTIEPMASKTFENRGKLARLYGMVSRDWFRQHLTSQAILDYYQEWIQAWAALQRFVPSSDMLSNPCTCAGWVDTDRNKMQNATIQRCSCCAAFPVSITKGCMEMMGTGSNPSLCK